MSQITTFNDDSYIAVKVLFEEFSPQIQYILTGFLVLLININLLIFTKSLDVVMSHYKKPVVQTYEF